MDYKVRIFMDGNEVDHTNLKKYIIKNETVDKIVNCIVDKNQKLSISEENKSNNYK